MDGILHVVRPFHSHTGKLNMDKKAVHPKLIDSFNSIPIKIMGDIFAEVYKLIPKFIWNCKECSRQSNFEKEEQSRGLIQPEFRSYYKTIIIMIMWY